MAPRQALPILAISPANKVVTKKPTQEEEPPVDFTKEAEDFLDQLLTPSTTTTTTTTTTIPQTPQPGETLSDSLDRQIQNMKPKLQRVRFPSKTIEQVSKTGVKPNKTGFGSLLGRIGIGALNYTIIKPLQTLDVGRRVVLSSARELGDVFGEGDASLGDWYNQAKNVNLSSKDLFNIKTNHKWLDSALGFGIDVLADPITYLTLGTGTAAKIAATQATRVIGRELTQELVEKTAKEAAEIGVKKATENLQKRVAIELGEAATKKETKVAARALAVEAAQLAQEQGVKGASRLVNQATRRYTAVGPRVQIGNKAKVAQANALREVRERAAIEAAEFAGTAQGRLAQKFVDTITDDVIAQVASKGSRVLRSPQIAKTLGARGGFRFGVGAAKVSIPGSDLVTRPAGTLLGGTRLGLSRIKFPGFNPISDLFRGKGGRGAAKEIFLAKSGLAQGRLSTEDTMRALDILNNDAVWKGFKGSIKNSINIATQKVVGGKARRAFDRTVYELLESPELLEGTALDAGRAIGRVVPEAEFQYAKEIAGLGQEYIDSINQLRVTAKPLGAADLPLPRNWFPQTLTAKAVKFLNSGTPEAAAAKRALGIEGNVLVGQTMANQLERDVSWFGSRLTGDEGIKELNRIARETVGGDFFDTSASSALRKFADKFAGDYALLRTVDYYDDAAETVGQIRRPSFLTDRELPADEMEAALRSVLPEWAAGDFVTIRNQLKRYAESLGDSVSSKVVREQTERAIAELDGIAAQMQEAIARGDDAANAWFMLGDDLQNAWADFLSLGPDKAKNMLDEFSPRILRSMVNMIEDAYVTLDSMIVPDARVRSDIASMYLNTKQLKKESIAQPAINVVKGFNQWLKTWVTSTPGFHNRNALSNFFQMFAAGAKVNYLKEASSISGKWNDFLVKEAANGRNVFIMNDDELIDLFLTEAKIPKNQAIPAKEALRFTSAAGFGDLEEFYDIAGSRVGFLGREVQGDSVVAKLSEKTGAVPRASRNIGEKMERWNRFMLTYDGIRQGLSPQEAAERTSKFLVDYSDLSTADEFLRQVIPFWMWMSRNLPTQAVNMFMYPQAYVTYDKLRRNFEDEKGNNVLVPDYLEQAGVAILGMTPLGALYAKPDFGFPGVGTPSPLSEGVTDPRSLFASTTPLARTPIELFLTEEKAFSGAPLEGAGEKASYAAEQFLPPLSTLSRYLNPLVAGREIPIIENIPGVRPKREAPALTQNVQALGSLLGLPGGIISENEQNIKRFQILEALKELERNPERYRR